MNLQTFLINELKSRKKKNSSYSLRSFAKALGIHSSTLTRILHGKRLITPRLADRILSRLDIDPSLKSTILLGLHETPKKQRDFEQFFKPLSKDEIETLNSWYHFGILSSFEIKGSQPTVQWISKYFNLPEAEVRKALECLERLQLVSKASKTHWKLSGVATSSRKVSSEVRLKIHAEYIEKAKQALAHERTEDDFSGITMAVNIKKLPEAVRRIMEFRRNLAEFLCTSESTELHEVYRLNIQLFSLKKAGL